MHQEKMSRKCSWKKQKLPKRHLVKSASLDHSAKQGNSNSYVSNRVKEMGDIISTIMEGMKRQKRKMFCKVL